MASKRIRFGDFVLDRGTRQLLRRDDARRLGPKAFTLLELLLEHRPNVVTKELSTSSIIRSSHSPTGCSEARLRKDHRDALEPGLRHLRDDGAQIQLGAKLRF